MLFSVPGLFQIYVSSEATDRSFRTDPAQLAAGALNGSDSDGVTVQRDRGF